MAEEFKAWKVDALGLFLEMLLGAKKDYSIDWTDFVGAVDVANVQMTIPVGLTLVGNPTINGKVVQFVLHANGAKGTYECQMLMTAANGVPIEPLPFRVVVK